VDVSYDTQHYCNIVNYELPYKFTVKIILHKIFIKERIAKIIHKIIRAYAIFYALTLVKGKVIFFWDVTQYDRKVIKFLKQTLPPS